MAIDLGKYQITVNYLQPGAIVTALSQPFFEDPEFRAYWEKKAPVGRLEQPEDIAGAALSLASDEAEFVSGVGFNVDGGAIVNFWSKRSRAKRPQRRTGNTLPARPDAV